MWQLLSADFYRLMQRTTMNEELIMNSLIICLFHVCRYKFLQQKIFTTKIYTAVANYNC